jgi:hypothetical protein
MSSIETFTVNDIPDLSSKTILITGGNSGLGYECALALSSKGAQLTIACRDEAKAAQAIERIKAVQPNASIESMTLDLASLDSVCHFAEAYKQKNKKLDILINNAGVMALPYAKTKDGFEMQFGTNHLGHFALTGLLLETLLASEGARVVNVSSIFHRFGKIDFQDLQWERGYKRWPAYGRSKLANLLFTYELQHRFKSAEVKAIALASHPGYSNTNLQLAAPQLRGSSLGVMLNRFANNVLAQKASAGALPSLMAATSDNVSGGDFIGPSGLGELWGAPRKTTSNRRSRDLATAKLLFDVSEQLTGVSYDRINKS